MTNRPRTTRRNSPASAPATHGIGRRPHGVPGVHQYTHFRSQLEIRFVKELETRGFRWFYEPERLGDYRYLVDFYLPDCKAWVEVKGVLSTRDHDGLRDVAILVKSERRHRLFMFTTEHAYLVTGDGFKPITQEQFWTALETLRTTYSGVSTQPSTPPQVETVEGILPIDTTPDEDSK